MGEDRTGLGFSPEEEDAGGWGDCSNTQQEVVLLASGGHQAGVEGRPPPFVLCLTLVGGPLDAVVSASEVVAGGWPSLRGPGAALSGPGWGAGWGQEG